ncbi:MAG TPA: hypothetical protein VGR91_17225 [Stellaceae bacterium]|nr:hypothetical protein [Stellaceae bacterium]
MQLWQSRRRPLVDFALLLLIAAAGAVGLSAARFGEWAVASL